jgi:2-polyprenyl-3-methyl-5-hydroxy-6-metoxy-1,4-benzoquinol methylase
MHRRLDRIANTLIGIDIDAEAISRIQEEGWDIQVADAQSFDLDMEFDVIAAPNVIEHLHSPGQFLQQAADHLVPNGRVLISTPRIWSLHHILTWLKDREVVVDPTHTCWFNDPTFRRLIQLSELSVLRHETFAWRRPPASKLDRMYLALERILRQLGLDDAYFDYQHFYCLAND